MGGRGSGSFADDGSTHGGGRGKRAAVAVAGSGEPICPDGLPDVVEKHWQAIADVLSGVAKSQDSDAITSLAWLSWQQCEFRRKLLVSPLDETSTRLSLAVGRSLLVLWSQFGMTPRSRQLLLTPVGGDEVDDFEEMDKAL